MKRVWYHFLTDAPLRDWQIHEYNFNLLIELLRFQIYMELNLPLNHVSLFSKKKKQHRFCIFPYIYLALVRSPVTYLILSFPIDILLTKQTLLINCNDLICHNREYMLYGRSG